MNASSGVRGCRPMLLGCVVIAALAGVIWGVAQRWLIQQVVRLDLVARNAGERWSLEWTRASDGVANGVWLDIRGLGQAAGGGIRLKVRQPLPVYPLSDVRLNWWDSPGLQLQIQSAMVDERVLGERTARAMVPLHAGAGAAVVGDGDLGFRATAPGGCVLISVPRRGCLRSHLLGYGASLGAMAALVVFIAAGRGLLGVARRNGHLVFVSALGLVVVGHVWMAATLPFLYPPDSIDYIWSAAVFRITGGLDHVNPVRVPGFPLLIAPLMPWFEDFGAALGWVQAGFGVGSALLAYGIVRRLLPRPWPTLAMLAVGLNPILLAYERIALSETLATFCIMLAGWLLVRAVTPAGRAVGGLPGVAWAALAGLVCGLSAYVRGNFQLLVPLAPAVIVLAGWRAGAWRAGLLRAGVAGAIGLACLAPWVIRNERLFGQPRFILGRDNARLIFGYTAGLVDENQTRLFEYDHWRRLDEQRRNGALDAYAFSRQIHSSRVPPTVASAGGLVPAVDKVCGSIIDESLARRPLHRIAAAASASGVQLGLWDRAYCVNENSFWSRPLRGALTRPVGGTNFFFAPEAFNWPYVPPGWNAEMVRRLRHDIGYVAWSRHAQFFNEWFLAYRFISPAVGVLALLGTWYALRARCWPLVGIGALIIANALYIGIVLLCDADRYSAPFTGLTLILALFAVRTLASRYIASASATSAQTHDTANTEVGVAAAEAGG